MTTRRRRHSDRYTITRAGEEYLDARHAAQHVVAGDALDEAITAAIDAAIPRMRELLRRELVALLTNDTTPNEGA